MGDIEKGSGKRYSDGAENVGKKTRDEIVNPDGIYSGMARRNAHVDGEFFPQASEGVRPRRRGHRD